MNSRTVRIAWFALAAFATIALVRLAYNLIHYNPWQESLQLVEGKVPADWKAPEPLSSGPQGFYTKSSAIWLAVSPEEFSTVQSQILKELNANQAIIQHQKQSSIEDTEYSMMQSVIGAESANALIQRWKSSHEVLRFEEDRRDRSAEYASLKARLESLQQTRARITITPEQFKLSASREVSEEEASLQTRLDEFERARAVPASQAITAVIVARPGLGFSSFASMLLDAMWWSIALFGALTILALFGYLVLRLFQGGKEFLGWVNNRLDPKS
ncbi:MAG: hypothetical protein CMF59_11585 [Leptospiraceae bacterium]|nr:hypothetical protein [Leptospiraceae bacterium]